MKHVILGGSVQGASHIRAGTNCQDSFKRINCSDGTVILAVVDGHGSKSCPYSKTGSGIAVNIFCEVMASFHDKFADSGEMLLTYLNREGDTKVAQAVDAEWKRRVLKVHANNKREVPLLDNGEKNKQEIYKQYGSTVVGLMITPLFLFSFQLGDGDITYVDGSGFNQVLRTEKILGTETYSLSRPDSWKKAVSAVRRREASEELPFAFMLSTDGFASSYKDDEEFRKACVGYFQMLKEHGAEAVSANIKEWLAETSAMGCGDDITLLIAYFTADESEVIADGQGK